MANMDVIGGRVDQYVVNICYDITPNHVLESFVYEGLKRCWCIHESITDILVVPLESGVKGSLPLIPFSDTKLQMLHKPSLVNIWASHS